MIAEVLETEPEELASALIAFRWRAQWKRMGSEAAIGELAAIDRRESERSIAAAHLGEASQRADIIW